MCWAPCPVMEIATSKETSPTQSPTAVGVTPIEAGMIIPRGKWCIRDRGWEGLPDAI